MVDQVFAIPSYGVRLNPNNFCMLAKNKMASTILGE